ncbi:MAG TPA: hypothetical protein VGV87_13180 [Blastocatellia bacterium]|nr:hypothetical protein [Blastocatellia bacterium]
MKIKKLILSTIFSLLVASSVLGQSATQAPATPDGGKAVDEKPDKKALEKKALALIDEILKEAANLRLPENRIRLQAGTADLLWKIDEKRARSLFKQAMDALGDLIAEARAPQSSRSSSRSFEYEALAQVRTQLRQEILQMIAQHDARLARDFLRGTRQAAPAGALNQERDDQEVQMELELAQQIAVTDPSQALQIAEDSLESGPPGGELPNIIQQLATKDRDAAAKLTADLMKKFRSANLSTDRTTRSVAIALVSLATNREEFDSASAEKRSSGLSSGPSPPQILDDKTLRELVDLLAVAALAPVAVDRGSSSGEQYYNAFLVVSDLQSLMPQIEKYTPSRAAALKKRFAEITNSFAPEMRVLLEPKPGVDTASVDGLLEAAADAPTEARDGLWIQAAMKALEEGHADRARAIVTERCSDPSVRDQLLEQIDSRALSQAAESGRLDEARLLLAQASVEERVSVLTQFASRASTKGDKKAALQMLEEARGLVGAQAANGAELNALLEIARAYITVEPARSFDMVEPVVDHLNRLLAAAEVVDGFEFTGYFKDGELLQVQGQSPLIGLVLQCADDTGTLARVDFERARAVADKFQSNDVRLKARLAIAQGILSDNPRARVMSAPVSGRYSFRRTVITLGGSAGQVIVQH